MKQLIFAVLALVLCLAFLPGASRDSPEYLVNGWSDSSRPPETFVFDRSLHELRILPDIVVAARNSPDRLRFLGKPLYLAGSRTPVPPCEMPSSYAVTPSGSYYVCFQGYHPKAVLRVFQRTGRVWATRHVAIADTWDLHAVAFLDDDRLLFESFDPHCPDESSSISVMSISGRFVPRKYFACANGVFVGNHRIAYLRGIKDGREYSLDGKTWIRGKLYGLDVDDQPITDDSPLMHRFMQLHPLGGIRWVSVGGSR